MKQIILGLLLAVMIPESAIAQSMRDYWLMGYKEGYAMCYLIGQGITDRERMIHLFRGALTPTEMEYVKTIDYHVSNYGKDELVTIYLDGYVRGTLPCQDEYAQIFLNK